MQIVWVQIIHPSADQLQIFYIIMEMDPWSLVRITEQKQSFEELRLWVVSIDLWDLR